MLFDTVDETFLGRVEISFSEAGCDLIQRAHIVVTAKIPRRTRFGAVEGTLLDEGERLLRTRLGRLDHPEANIFADPDIWAEARLNSTGAHQAA
ncbi:MAG: hypothetical protein EBU97_02465 [Rhodobacteraceae bacterium]|nr:hypothetical protein [Paracoccaceae bacterium]